MTTPQADEPIATDLDAMGERELRTLAGQLMVRDAAGAPLDQLKTMVRNQIRIIDALDRNALVRLVVHARRPVARDASKRELVREIAQARIVSYDRLELDALSALARLRGLHVPPTVTDDQLRDTLRRNDGLSGYIRRTRRKLVGRVLQNILDRTPASTDDYQFLPKEKPSNPALGDEIEDQGVVGGIASRLRGAADDYIDHKLDEIDRRIDRKLDEIDQRLAEWRDREIENRLRIVKITLIGTVIVAAISLVYSYIEKLR